MQLREGNENICTLYFIILLCFLCRYRIAAFDHGLFSFSDVPHGQWPVILVTNPKNSMFGLPHKESVEYMINSTHIRYCSTLISFFDFELLTIPFYLFHVSHCRVLVFSPTPLGSVRLRIDDENWVQCVHIKGPLYVSAWNPKKYVVGLHNIQVNLNCSIMVIKGCFGTYDELLLISLLRL